MKRPARRLVAVFSSIAFLCGAALPASMAGAAETLVTVKNFTDRAVMVRLANSPTGKYCVGMHSEGQFRVEVTSVNVMEGGNCHGTVAHGYPVYADARLVELRGSNGEYHMVERSS